MQGNVLCSGVEMRNERARMNGRLARLSGSVVAVLFGSSFWHSVQLLVLHVRVSEGIACVAAGSRLAVRLLHTHAGRRDRGRCTQHRQR